MTNIRRSDVSGEEAREGEYEHRSVKIRVRDAGRSVNRGSAQFDFHFMDDPEEVREEAHRKVDKALRRAGLELPDEDEGEDDE